jgi:hypothetical protein
VLSNFRLPHWISTALVAACVGLGAVVVQAKAGALPVTPQVLGVLTILGGISQYVLGLLQPSIIPSTNLRAAKTAGLLDAVKITQTMVAMLSALLLFGAVLSACLKPPTPAQQAQDGETLTVCIAQYWGLPIVAVAAACTGNELTVAEDVIADIEYAIENATGSLPDAGPSTVAAVTVASPTFSALYASDPEVKAHLEKLKAGIVMPPDAGR